MSRTAISAIQRHLKVADEAWIALVLLHRENPRRESFTAREIFEKVKDVASYPALRSGIQPYISLHNVANVPMNSAPYRMFYRTLDGRYRLFRPGDDFHPSRSGKTRPHRDELPERYRALVDWYERVYCQSKKNGEVKREEDPFLGMRGVGKEIWDGVDADEFVDSLRSGWDR